MKRHGNFISREAASGTRKAEITKSGDKSLVLLKLREAALRHVFISTVPRFK